MVKNDPKWSKNDFKMVQNNLKMVQKWSQKVLIMVQNGPKKVQKWFENGPKVDHQVDLRTKGSNIITHIGLRAIPCGQL